MNTINKSHVKVFSFVIAVVIALGACTTLKMSRIPSTYTPETTYLKLKDQFTQLAVADRNLPDSIKLYENIKYQKSLHEAGLMDVYQPRKVKKGGHQAIVMVHGGGWNNGSKENMRALAIALAQKGYVAIAVNYRLTYEAKYPAAIYDVKQASQYIFKHAAKWNIDKNNIAILGGSAGGQIASLTAVTANKFIVPTGLSEPLRFNAVIDLDGVLDFTDKDALIFENDPAKKVTAAGAWFGGRYQEVQHLWREASPVYYLNEDTPPFLILRSGQPRFSVGYKQVAAELSRMNIKHHVHTFEDSPHAYWLLNLWLDKTAVEIDKFLLSL